MDVLVGKPIPGHDFPAPVPVEILDDPTYNQAWLLEFRARRGDINLPVQIIESESGLIFESGTKILSDEDISLIGVLMGSRGYTLVPITDLKGQGIFYAALIFVGTTRFDDENEPRFDSFAQVEEWIKEPGLGEVVNALRGVILMRNPFVKKNYLPAIPTPAIPP